MAEKRKFSLVRAFAKAVLGVVLFASSLYGGWYGANYAGRGERLTPGERTQVEEVFGSQMNPDRIRKHMRGEDDIVHIFRDAAGMVIPPTGHIDFYGDAWHSQDYSHDTRLRYGMFMHEVTHCYQGQHLNFPLNNLHVYKYELKPDSRFSDFGFEQQAEIIRNYSENFLYPAGAHAPRNDAERLLARVVEDQFPQAKISRERLEREREQQPHAQPVPLAPQLPPGIKTA